MAGKVRNFYAGGNTARGFYSLFDSVLAGLDRLYILKGGPGTGKSAMIKRIGEHMTTQGYDIELIHCASANGSVDGVIVPSLKLGVVDGTAPHVIEPKAPGAIEEYVNLGTAWDSEKLRNHRTEIVNLSARISEQFQSAYATFAEALTIHDEWEKIYTDNLQKERANDAAQTLIEKIFGEERTNKTPHVRHLFLGAATPQGAVDFIPNLTEDIGKRYFIKGRPGSGKSSLLKKLAQAAENRGYDVEVYHCGLDPYSLDMVIVPERSVAVFDSTAPHEYFPERENDEGIDMYALAIAPGTDEKYAAQLRDIQSRYAAKMKAGTAYLAKAKALHDELEAYYVAAMDFDKIAAIREHIQSEIDTFAAQR